MMPPRFIANTPRLAQPLSAISRRLVSLLLLFFFIATSPLDTITTAHAGRAAMLPCLFHFTIAAPL